jgi:hypothetical protein
MAGHSYDDIADEVGYANRGTAWKTVQKALDSRVMQSVDDYRDAELARLNALEEAHWEAAVSGENLKAAELCLKISTQRTKLLGLDSVIPEEKQLATIVIGGSKDDYISGLKEIIEQ